MISLILPTYNERSNMEPLLQRIQAALNTTREAFEIIIVDDHSPDGTADEVCRLAADNRPWLRLLVRETPRDLSTAVVAGWKIAQGEILGCMDADLQHPPETLLRLLAELRQTGADIAIGSRNLPGGGASGWSPARRLVSRMARGIANLALPDLLQTVSDPMSGYFLLRRSVLAHEPLQPIGYKLLLEVLVRGEYSRVVEVPFIFEIREKGSSKINAQIVLKFFIHLRRLSKAWRKRRASK